MGLDMYFIRVKGEDSVDDFTIKNKEYYQREFPTIQYYRKYYELHVFMCKIYCSKMNTRSYEGLNESMMRIEPNDLDNIGKDVTLNRINDLIEKIRQVWKSGDTVYYFPSW
jgi:hypothetical protein